MALITGANRGIGRHLIEALRERGVTKVYATARRPESIDDSTVEKLRLDLTDDGSVIAAAQIASDVTILINNAGISTGTSLVTGDLAAVHREMDTHFFGTLGVIRAFAPVLERNGGGAIVNVLSATSWFAAPGNSAYSAAKAAAWNMTNAVRWELAEQGTLVQGVHLGATDTDLASEYHGAKIDPGDVVAASLDGLVADRIEVVVDEHSAVVKASLAHDPKDFYASMNTFLV